MFLSLTGLALFLTACPGCDDGPGFGVLEVEVEASPTAVEIDTIWGGGIRTRTIELRNVGEATAVLGAVRIQGEAGPASLSTSLAGERISTGAAVTLTLRLTAEEDGLGQYTANVIVPVDGADDVEVSIAASIRPAPDCTDDNPCTQDRFDVETGECIFDTVPDFVPCDDGNACTEADLCLTGRCVGNAIRCDDNIPCTIDGCNEDTGCVYEPAPSLCDDDNPCTEDVCSPGFGCENPIVTETTLCHFNGCVDIGFCAGPVCVIQDVPNGLPCEDGDACTLNDTCQAGVCAAGVPGTPGAAEPVLLTSGAALEFNDCLHANPLGCGGLFQAEPEEVLDVTRIGPLSVVVFRTAFVEVDTNIPCDPEEHSLATFPMVVEEDAGPAGGEAPEPVPPLPQVCAAGIFVAAYADAFPPPINIPETRVLQQVGVTHGPSSAQFGAADGVAQTVQLNLAHYDFYSAGNLYVEGATIGLDAVTNATRETLAWPEIPGAAPQAVAIAGTGGDDVAVVGIPARRGVCIVGCEDPVFLAATQLPMWVSQAGQPFSSANPTGAINIEESSSCGAIEQPTDVTSLSFSLEARPEARVGTLSFNASTDACLPSARSWKFSFDIDTLPVEVFRPIEAGAEDDELPPDDGGVVAVDGGLDVDAGPPRSSAHGRPTGIEHNGVDRPATVVEAIDCEQAGPGGCRQVVLVGEGERTIIADHIGTSLVSAAPFAVDSDHRTALFFGPRAEMRWFDDNQSLRRLPAPPLETFSFRGARARFARGETGESLATVAQNLIGCSPDELDCDDAEQITHAVVLQRFSCGFGVGDLNLGDPCQDSRACGDGRGCDFEQGCQPPPNCVAGDCLQECWGVCAVPEGPCENRQASLCDADGTCRLVGEPRFCAPAEDCTADSCAADEVCTGVIDTCALGSDAGCTTARICVPAPDGGPMPDGGVVDAGGEHDSGALPDGGASLDSGTLFDGGASFDDGGVSDGGLDAGDGG